MFKIFQRSAKQTPVEDKPEDTSALSQSWLTKRGTQNPDNRTYWHQERIRDAEEALNPPGRD